MENHGFFDIPNLVPAANAMVKRVKPKFDVSSDTPVGVVESGNVEMDLQKPIRLRKKKKTGKVKRKSKNTRKSKDKKQR